MSYARAMHDQNDLVVKQNTQHLLANRLCLNLREYQAVPLTDKIMTCLKTDPTVDSYGLHNVYLLHGEYIFLDGMPILRITTDVHTNSTNTFLDVHDLDNPKPFIELSNQWHELLDFLTPLEAFLKSHAKWLSNNRIGADIYNGVINTMPEGLWDGLNVGSDDPLNARDTIRFDKYAKKNHSYYARIQRHILVGML